MEKFNFRNEEAEAVSIPINESIISILFKIFLNLTNQNAAQSECTNIMDEIFEKPLEGIYTLSDMIVSILRKFSNRSTECKQIILEIVEKHAGNEEETQEQKMKRLKESVKYHTTPYYWPTAKNDMVGHLAVSFFPLLACCTRIKSLNQQHFKSFKTVSRRNAKHELLK